MAIKKSFHIPFKSYGVDSITVCQFDKSKQVDLEFAWGSSQVCRLGAADPHTVRDLLQQLVDTIKVD